MSRKSIRSSLNRILSHTLTSTGATTTPKGNAFGKKNQYSNWCPKIYSLEIKLIRFFKKVVCDATRGQYKL